ncbi:uncharacterized protein LOC144058120 [Vanacampus margaritifer]
MLSLKTFLHERLAALAEEIFNAVERTVDEYTEELCRVKDLEIGRLRMQLSLLPTKDECNGAQQQEYTHHHLPSPPPPTQKHEEAAPADMEEGSSSNLEHSYDADPQVKKEPARSLREFWLGHGPEPLEDLESDMPLTSGAGHDPILPFHLDHGDDGNEKPYSCSVCDKRFRNCTHLAAHTRTHTGERPYICDICRKTFVTTSALNRHQTIHTEGKRHVCIYCNKTFKWMDSLGRHMRIAHKRSDSPQ